MMSKKHISNIVQLLLCVLESNFISYSFRCYGLQVGGGWEGGKGDKVEEKETHY